ncbi:MAG: hypothetical protein ABI600_21345 [Luteolibacter sp.]
MKTSQLPILFAVSLLASCASESGTHHASDSSTPARKSMSERLNEKNGYQKDANGNWIPQSDKRSAFENKGEDPNFAKKFNKTNYKTGDYAKKSWWGNKDYDSKTYAGNTDGSRFQKSSNLQGQGARESGNAAKIAAPYKTGDYATNTAREASKNPMAKPSNDGIENRKKTYQAPEIIDWQEQRNLSMDQSKGILGR